MLEDIGTVPLGFKDMMVMLLKDIVKAEETVEASIQLGTTWPSSSGAANPKCMSQEHFI